MANSLQEALDAIRERGEQFYVYVLLRACGTPFYVGKGRHDRIACHERNARQASDKTRKTRVVRAMLQQGQSVGYVLVGFWDDEVPAFAEERRLIVLHGRADAGGLLVNHTDGGEGCSNPSTATIAKRTKKLRAVMRDPVRKAAAVTALRSNDKVRKQRAREATQTPEFGAASSKRLKLEWADPEIAARRIAGMHASHDLVWKANHAEGIARAWADPVLREKRRAAFATEEVRSAIRKGMAQPEAVAARRANAIAQRARQEEARKHAMTLAAELRADVVWPIHISGTAVWEGITRRLLAGERVIDADPERIAEKFAAISRTPERRHQMSIAGHRGAQARWGNS